VIEQAAYKRRWRPTRYWLAALIGGALFGVLVASSALSIALDSVPHRASLFGLPAIGLMAVATVFGLRAFRDRKPGVRGRDLMVAAVLFGLGICSWLLVLDVFTFTQAAGPGAAALSALACLPTTAFGLLVVRRLDRNEKEPWRLVLVAAVWGAIVATSLVIWAEALWDEQLGARLVPGPALDASSAFSAGVFEELAKGVAVVLLYLVMRDEFDDVVDGIVYGAAVGFGFNFMESITYMTHLYAVYRPESASLALASAAGQWYQRQVLGLFLGHATYTALVGAGVGVARQLPRLPQRLLAIASGFVVAIAAHFAWDAWAQFFPVSPTSPLAVAEIHLRILVMVGPFTAALLLILAMGLRVEGAALARQLELEAEAGSGAVLPAEVPVLISPWRRLGVRVAAMARGGPVAYSRLARLQTAQIHLAMERWHRERQETDTPPAAEEALRRQVLELRAATAL
jgi:RsiW-degrading membrane proteinase PrsW (M82 family)